MNLIEIYIGLKSNLEKIEIIRQKYNYILGLKTRNLDKYINNKIGSILYTRINNYLSEELKNLDSEWQEIENTYNRLKYAHLQHFSNNPFEQ